MTMASTAPMISRYQAAGARLETMADFSNDQGVLNCEHCGLLLATRHLGSNLGAQLRTR